MMNRILIVLSLLLNVGLLLGQTYHIGDIYTDADGNQGIVYYLHPDGSGGWAVALNDLTGTCPWGTLVDVPDIPNQNPDFLQQLMSDTAGIANTIAIREVNTNNHRYAAWSVDVDNGWVLPAPAQLSMLYARLPLIRQALLDAGGTDMVSDYYWTSAERSENSAWIVDFGRSVLSGLFNWTNKDGYLHVRPVCCFKTPTLSYSWNTGQSGEELTVNPTQTTQYQVTVTTGNGCSDVASHTVVVLPNDWVNVRKTACQSYVLNGETYTESGIYLQQHAKTNGCDSTVVLHLSLTGAPDIQIESSQDTICEGHEVQLQAVVDCPEVQTPFVAIGDILCTDGSVVSPSIWPCGKTALGVVFYVDSTRQHGWAMHLRELVGDKEWSRNSVDLTGLTNFEENHYVNDFDGYGNTQVMRAAGNAFAYPIAYAMDFHNGWYVPALGQLTVMYGVLGLINHSLQIVNGDVVDLNGLAYYWSSTEYDNLLVWVVMTTGFQTLHSKTEYSNTRLRAVRSF